MSSDEFRERVNLEGYLNEYLVEHLWNHHRPLRLGGGEFEVVGGEEVPGYKEDDAVILFRRKTDGVVFEIEIEPEARIVYRPGAEKEARV